MPTTAAGGVAGSEWDSWMTQWRRRWQATIASDVHTSDGLGWEFTCVDGGECVWEVFREDGGPFPVFSATPGPGTLPPREDLEEMTTAAVTDLLAAAGLSDEHGWNARNITAALLLAACDVRSWEGEEWGLESGPDDHPLTWSEPDAARTPYAWLRARCTDRDAVISIYQEDASFGLCFIPTHTPGLPASDEGSLRSRRDIPLSRGRLHRVDVVYDTLAEADYSHGLLTEVLLHADTSSTLLIAAEAYAPHEWHLYDESVVALTDPSAADTLPWIPERRSWRPAGGRIR